MLRFAGAVFFQAAYGMLTAKAPRPHIAFTIDNYAEVLQVAIAGRGGGRKGS